MSWESLQKEFLFVGSTGCTGEGKRRRKTTSRVISVKVVFLSPLSPSHSPFAFYSPSCKTVLLLLPRWLSFHPRTALQSKARQKRRSSSPWPTWSLCDSRATGFQPKSSWTSLVASPSELAEPKMKPKINFLFAEQTFGSHMFDPPRPKPWRGPFRKSNRIPTIRFAKPPWYLSFSLSFHTPLR